MIPTCGYSGCDLYYPIRKPLEYDTLIPKLTDLIIKACREESENGETHIKQIVKQP